MQTLSLSINEEIKSRITFSALMARLSPETIEAFLLDQLDRCGLGHNTFTPEALALIVRSGDGILRRTRTTGGWGASGETAAGSPQGETSGSERIN